MANTYYTYGTNLQNREFFTSTVRTDHGIKRYFSNVEGEIYFGNKLMEDIYKFDFIVEEKKLPLYGYNCYYPELIIPGQRIVQGSFILNFTNGSFMSQVLKTIDDSILCHQVIESEPYNPSQEVRDKALWSKNFDITIGYGYYKNQIETYNATCQTICGVQITNMQSVLDVSGEPIMEVYSFIAKDYIDGDMNIIAPDKNTNDNNDETTEAQQYIYADINNKDEYTKKYNEHLSNSDAIGLVHNVIFNAKNNKELTVTISNFDGDLLNCENLTVLVTEQLNHNFITYKLEKKNDNSFFFNFSKLPNDGNILYETFKEDELDKIMCTLKYKVQIGSKKHDIKYDGYIYPNGI